MTETFLTTVQIDAVTREKLRALAAKNMRSMAAQVRWMVEREVEDCTCKPNQEMACPTCRAAIAEKLGDEIPFED